MIKMKFLFLSNLLYHHYLLSNSLHPKTILISEQNIKRRDRTWLVRLISIRRAKQDGVYDKGKFSRYIDGEISPRLLFFLSHLFFNIIIKKYAMYQMNVSLFETFLWIQRNVFFQRNTYLCNTLYC